MLAGRGYSQTFIEEIVKGGPEVGNSLAESLANADASTTAQLQGLYSSLEDVSAHGLDILASQMNTSTKMATSDLLEAYAQVSVDLKETLSGISSDLMSGLDKANEAYADAMAVAEESRTAQIADAQTNLNTAIAESTATLKSAIADADQALKDAQEEARKGLDAALLDASDAFAQALIDSQTSYQDAIDALNDATTAKLETLKGKLEEVASQLKTLGAAQAALDALANQSVFNPFNVLPSTGGLKSNSGSAVALGAGGDQGAGRSVTVNAPITNNNTTSPNTIGATIATLVKYGVAIVIGDTK
jgi:DNA repair exonuclease SbcCD ATPase subunit